MRPRRARTGRRRRSSALALLGVLLLGAAAPALAKPTPGKAPVDDPRDVAAERHYVAGQRLHNEGLFQEAIAEFQEAYRIKPHPNVIYNIAQAYERLLDYGAAVAWFERYLREGGPTATYRIVVENRLRVLRGLPSRIHVESTPPATASLIDPDGVGERAATPTEFRVKAGRYTLRVNRDGYLAQERRIAADIGQPYFFQFNLQQQRELVTIRPNPAQARVFLDQKLVSTGLYADRIPVGRHSLLVEYNRYESFETEFILKPGHKIDYDIVLPAPPPTGRLEFVIGTGVYGAVALPLLLHASGVTPKWQIILPTAIGGGGLGALAGFFSTPHSIREANASLILAGVSWGGLEGLSLGVLNDHNNSRLIAGLSLAGSVAGLGAALALVRPLHPTSGQAAIINSGGFWGMGLGIGLGYALRGDRRDLDLTLIIGLNIGLVTSGVLVNHFDLSRMHMFLIDVGTAAGAAAGSLIGFAASGSDPLKSDAGTATVARGALLGGAVGLATAIVLTRNYDRRGRGTTARDSLISFESSGVRLGFPAAQLTPVARPEGGTDLQVTLKLAQGTF